MTDHEAVVEPQAANDALSQPTLNPLSIIWRHKWLLALGVVIGVVMGALYYARVSATYQSSAQVLVVKKTPDALPLPNSEARVPSTEDYLSTHQTLIRSPLIVSTAVQKGKLGSLKAFAGHEDPVGDIIAALKVTREMSNGYPTNILNISYRGPVAEDCPTVVSAVIDSYRQFLNARYKSVSDETAQLITQANDILEKKLSTKQKEYDRFTLEHPTLWRNKDGLSSAQLRLGGIEAKRSALLLQEKEIEGRLAAFEKAVEGGGHSRSELLAMLSKEPRRSEDLRTTLDSSLEERLAALEIEEKLLVEDYGAEHPKVRSVRAQLTFVRSQLKRLGKLFSPDDQPPVNPVQTHIQTLKLELENTRMTVEALDKLLVEEQQKVKEQRSSEQQDAAYRTELARDQQLFDAISKRLDEVSILKNFAGGFEAETISPAEPGAKVAPRPLPVFATTALLGLLAGFGLCYLAEISDQSFRTPEEIRRRLGLPVVGHIPYFEGQKDDQQMAEDGAPALSPILCTVHEPRSRQAESYRGVRTAVYFSNRGEGHRVIQVTSPDMGDGKTTLAANLAVSIAHSAKKVILIDADFRRPCVHKLFAVPTRQGLASVIAGEADLADVIQPTGIPGLFVLPCGPIPPNPAELLTLPRFQNILAAIREEYDYVIVDTPPLLAVTDPCVVVPYVDGVLLTVRLSKSARPQALRAREVLSTLSARVLGVVVNAVGPDGGGYGYDNYRYGYGYRYKYEQEENGTEAETAGSPKESAPAAGPAAGEGSKGKSRTRRVPPVRPSSRGGLISWLLNL